MKIAVFTLSPLHAEDPILLAIKHAELEPVMFSMNASGAALAECAGFVIMGEWGHEHSDLPWREALRVQAHAGKPVLGVSEGAKVLLEMGLVPGVEQDKPAISLAKCVVLSSNILMRLSDQYQLNAFTRRLTLNVTFAAPDAGVRFVIPPALLMEMRGQGMDVFYYFDEAHPASREIAAVSNKMGNVMAMLSLPESLHEMVFKSMRESIQQGCAQPVAPLFYYPR